MGFTVAYSAVSWTAGDVITEAKLDAMVANDQAYDSHSAQGFEIDEMTKPSTPSANKVRIYAKDKSGVSTLYYLKDDGTEIEIGASSGDWEDLGALTYVSVDDPSGVVDEDGDTRSLRQAGMRIKFTQGVTVIYGIITDVNQTLQSGKTRITFLHEIDPTDSQALTLMANSAITLPYFSTKKAPLGFPLEPTKWSIQVVDTNTRTQATPTNGTWYNLGSELITIPIGCWNVWWSACAYITGSNNVAQKITLSTANNSQSDADFTAAIASWAGEFGISQISKQKTLTLTSKTPYYLNSTCDNSGVSSINYYGAAASTIIRAVCAYL